VETVKIIVAIFFMLLWYAVITIPCTLLILLPWLLTRRMKAGLSKHFIQSALIAIAYAPVIWGHAGPIPAVVGVMFNDPYFRAQEIASLVIVFVISFAVLTIRALYKNQHPPAPIAPS
jgi:uncharacterized membrane protein